MQVGIDAVGDKNKIAGRDFIEVVLPDKPTELLTSSQRKQLNATVKEIAALHNEHAGAIWKQVVHVPFGVSSVKDIPLARYADVEKALLEFAHSLTLAELIHERSVTKLAKKKVELWALEQFGARELQYLKPAELKKVLEFVDGLPAPTPGLPDEARPMSLVPPLPKPVPVPVPVPVQPAERPVPVHVKRKVRGGLLRWLRLMYCLTLRWPGHVLVLVLASAVAGKVFL